MCPWRILSDTKVFQLLYTYREGFFPLSFIFKKLKITEDSDTLHLCGFSPYFWYLECLCTVWYLVCLLWDEWCKKTFPHALNSHGFTQESFLLQNEIWNKAEVLSTLTTFFTFTESIFWILSFFSLFLYWSSMSWFSHSFTYWSQVPEGFPHHISTVSSVKDPIKSIPSDWSSQPHPYKPLSLFPSFWNPLASPCGSCGECWSCWDTWAFKHRWDVNSSPA